MRAATTLRERHQNQSSGVHEPLEKQIEHVIGEARMVLPGLQALFGFQLIAVFNQRFVEALGPMARAIHLAALFLVAIAIACIMAPAAYHRQVERDRISSFFVVYASRLIAAAMVALLIALCAEVGVVAIAVEGNSVLAGSLSGVLALVFCVLWYVLPWTRRGWRK